MSNNRSGFRSRHTQALIGALFILAGLTTLASGGTIPGIVFLVAAALLLLPAAFGYQSVLHVVRGEKGFPRREGL